LEATIAPRLPITAPAAAPNIYPCIGKSLGDGSKAEIIFPIEPPTTPPAAVGYNVNLFKAFMVFNLLFARSSLVIRVSNIKLFIYCIYRKD
jgi:hypothetical protein